MGFFWDEVGQGRRDARRRELLADQTTFAPSSSAWWALEGSLNGDARWSSRRKHEILETIKDPFRQRKALEALAKNLEPTVDFEALLSRPLQERQPGRPGAGGRGHHHRRMRQEGHREDRQDEGQGAARDQDGATVGRQYLERERARRAQRQVRHCAVFVDGFFAGSDRKETTTSWPSSRSPLARTPRCSRRGLRHARCCARSSKPRSRQRSQMREALLKVKDFPGVTGRTTVNADANSRSLSSFDDRPRQSASSTSTPRADPGILSPRQPVRQILPAQARRQSSATAADVHPLEFRAASAGPHGQSPLHDADECRHARASMRAHLVWRALWQARWR